MKSNSMSILGMILSCLMILCSCGCESQKPTPQKRPEGAQTATGRFAPTGSDPAVALDTQTGRLCRTTSTGGSHADLPQCGEGDAEHVEQVSVDPKKWENAEIAVTCSGKEHFLPTYPEGAKGEKNVVLNCTIENLTSKAVPLAIPAKVDALFRLHDGRVVRAPNVQSDYDCAHAELMNTDELLLTDTSNGVRYHVRVD